MSINLRCLFLIFCFVLASCGQQGRGSLSEELSQHLELGKRNAHNGYEKPSAPLGLSSGVIHRAEKGIDGIGWLGFDPSLEPLAYEEAELTSVSQDILVKYQDILQVEIDDLRPSERHFIRINEDLVSVNFERYFRGLIVRDAFVELIFSKQRSGRFKLTEMVNHSYGSIALANSGAEVISAHEWLQKYEGYVLESSHDAILPVSASGQVDFFLVKVLVAVRGDEAMTITVKNDSGEVVEAYSHRMDSGRILGKSFDRSYLDNNTIEKPLRLVSLLVGGQEENTDIDGIYKMPASSTGELLLASDRVNVADTLTRNIVKFDISLGEGDVLLGSSQSEIKAINAYESVFRANTFVRRSLSPDEVSYLNTSSNVVLNVSGSCNAFYDTRANSLNFFTEGRGCADTALLNDVIFHEWGHGLDFSTGRRGGITDGAFSEGIGDILATYITGGSELAKGFFLDSQDGIRTVENTNRFPDDQGEVHFEGLIISGAFWDLKVAMEERYGKKRGLQKSMDFFLRHLLTADSYRESYQAVLRLDDDDSNPATKSPNHCLITEAFANHGLAESEVCDDPKLVTLPKNNKDIHIGLSDSGETLMVSTKKLYSLVQGCYGDVYDCLEDGQTRFKFVTEGQSDSGRVISVTPDKVSIASQQYLTIFVADDGGEELYQSFKLSPR